ncbi:DUF6476 family protein [Donghicola tyrosinivorans]|jgi:hypothetical protein|nr:DUF6476 family protein [Donghicola tyrosinivorans]MEE3071250.1 DUF6476 family protein [Pseudomonadota bacterium]
MSLPSDQTPPDARFLRRLVTALTVVMMGGLLAITVVIVLRFPDPTPLLPEDLSLPEGVRVAAVTQGKGWFAITTEDQRILIFDAISGALVQDIKVTLPNSGAN